MLIEHGKKMVGMFLADVLHAKIINDQDELDGAPVVAPQARGGLRFVVSRRLQPFPKLIVR